MNELDNEMLLNDIAVFLIVILDKERLVAIIDTSHTQWKIKTCGYDRYVVVTNNGAAMREVLDRYEIKYI